MKELEKNIRVNGLTEWITFNEKNKKNETIEIGIKKCYPDNTWQTSLPNLWKKHAYIDKVIDTYYTVDVYVTLENNDCISRYNPTIKLSDDKRRMVLNFDWMLEVTEDNKSRLINEIIRLAFQK